MTRSERYLRDIRRMKYLSLSPERAFLYSYWSFCAWILLLPFRLLIAFVKW